MHFRSVVTVSLLAALSSALDNAFNNPPGGYQPVAGQTIQLSWAPTTQGTVTLVLRSGNAQSLSEGTPIAQNIQNSGSYSWSVPNSITQGSDYTIQIIDDSNPDNQNFTPYLTVQSSNTQPSQTQAFDFGAPTSLPTLPDGSTPMADSSGSGSSGAAAGLKVGKAAAALGAVVLGYALLL